MSALEEWEKHRTERSRQPAGIVDPDKADAAITELESHIEEWRATTKDIADERDEQKAKAEKAEAENARLKVCGTCGHFDEANHLCEEWNREQSFAGVRPQQGCGFAPPHSPHSHWTPYWETKPKEDL